MSDRRTVIDLSFDELETVDLSKDGAAPSATYVLTIDMQTNLITNLPDVSPFINLREFTASNNQITVMHRSIATLRHLKSLDLHNNLLTDFGLPKDLSKLTQLESLHLGGNRLRTMPKQLTSLSTLKTLHMGGNEIERIDCNLAYFKTLEILYLGDNLLSSIPLSIGCISNLRMLSLAHNNLTALPVTIGFLRRLKSLMLNSNNLSTLPYQITKLKLEELAIRDNPLILNFIRQAEIEVPSLQELAGRAIKKNNIDTALLPPCLVSYLSTAKRCVNPRCQGVYFTSKVDDVKFVDLCGMYHVPMMQYLCSSRCTRRSLSPAPFLSSEEESAIERRVLLG